MKNNLYPLKVIIITVIGMLYANSAFARYDAISWIGDDTILTSNDKQGVSRLDVKTKHVTSLPLLPLFNEISVSPGRQVVALNSFQEMYGQVYKNNDFKLIKKLKLNRVRAQGVVSTAFSTDYYVLVSTSSLSVYSYSSDKPLSNWPGLQTPVFNNDGKYILAISSDSKSITRINTTHNTATEIARTTAAYSSLNISSQNIAVFIEKVNDTRFNIISKGHNNCVIITDNGEPHINAVSVPANKVLIDYTNFHESKLELWSLTDCRRIKSFPLPLGSAYSATPDMNRIVFTNEEYIYMWEHDKKPLEVIDIHGKLKAISPDGERLAILNGTNLELIDRHGQIMFILPAGGEYAIFSNDNKYLVTGCSNGCYVYDVKTGQPLHKYAGQYICNIASLSNGMIVKDYQSDKVSELEDLISGYKLKATCSQIIQQATSTTGEHDLYSYSDKGSAYFACQNPQGLGYGNLYINNKFINTFRYCNMLKIRFAPDGKDFVITSKYITSSVSDLTSQSFTEIYNVTTQRMSAIMPYEIFYAGNGKDVAVQTNDNTIEIWPTDYRKWPWQILSSPKLKPSQGCTIED